MVQQVARVISFGSRAASPLMVSRARDSSPAADHVRGCRSERVGNLFHFLSGQDGGFVGGERNVRFWRALLLSRQRPLSPRGRGRLAPQRERGEGDKRSVQRISLIPLTPLSCAESPSLARGEGLHTPADRWRLSRTALDRSNDQNLVTIRRGPNKKTTILQMVFLIRSNLVFSNLAL